MYQYWCISYNKCTTQAIDFVDHNKLWKALKEIRRPGHLTYLLRNLYAGQEATARTGLGTTLWTTAHQASLSFTVSLSLLTHIH